MRIRLARPFLLLAAGLLAVAAPASAAVYHYTCVLNPLQEVPATTSAGLGGGRFIIDTDANTVVFWISYAGLSAAETAAHIHGAANPGANAGVKFVLPAGNPKVGVWNYAEADEAAILAGQMYTNIHTGNFPGGELRGQIVALNALLTDTQENPATGSAGIGWAVATVDTATNQLSYYVYHSGLSSPPTAGHLHGNALHGTNAGVKLALASLTSPISGTGVYAEADEAALLMGRWYVNLHTAAFPGGEIRGQLVPRVIPMDALQETPVNGSLASAGIGLVALDTLNNALSYDVRVIALSAPETAAHIHGFADLGSNAGVQTALPAGAQKLGTWTYGAANEADVIGGRAYFNVHTSANPGGEIRGQILDLPGQPAATLGVGAGPAGGLTGLAAAPNPSAGGMRLTFQLARTGSVSLAIVGVDGRVVRDLPVSLYAPGTHSYDWDGLDARGARVAPGMYFAIVRTPEGTSVTRLVRLR